MLDVDFWMLDTGLSLKSDLVSCIEHHIHSRLVGVTKTWRICNFRPLRMGVGRWAG